MAAWHLATNSRGEELRNAGSSPLLVFVRATAYLGGDGARTRQLGPWPTWQGRTRTRTVRRRPSHVPVREDRNEPGGRDGVEAVVGHGWVCGEVGGEGKRGRRRLTECARSFKRRAPATSSSRLQHAFLPASQCKSLCLRVQRRSTLNRTAHLASRRCEWRCSLVKLYLSRSFQAARTGDGDP